MGSTLNGTRQAGKSGLSIRFCWGFRVIVLRVLIDFWGQRRFAKGLFVRSVWMGKVLFIKKKHTILHAFV